MIYCDLGKTVGCCDFLRSSYHRLDVDIRIFRRYAKSSWVGRSGHGRDFEVAIDPGMINCDKFPCGQYVSGATQTCGLLHGTIKISDSD